ncbi:hypothetical protein GCM10009839_32700 [Catenulispora yoronensis]|uniref:Uncharacterized protein n=1 Tax=Catenulispora yoronensis TaxID=450799 RepID=A0ABN2U6U9_9ACTN
MQAQALYLTRREAASGAAVLTVDLPSGPSAVRIPPVRNGRLLKVGTEHGDVYFRVRVFRTVGARVRQVLLALVCLPAFLLGPLMIINGAATPPDPTAIPKCQGIAMDPGDICEITTYMGNTKTVNDYGYAAMAAKAQAGTGSLRGFGVGITIAEAVIGAGTAAVYLRRRNRPISLSAVPVATSSA